MQLRLRGGNTDEKVEAHVRRTAELEPDPASGTVLAEYLQHASPQFVAAELDKLGLLDAADSCGGDARARSGAACRAEAHACEPLDGGILAMCAMIVVVAETRHFGSAGTTAVAYATRRTDT